MSNLNIEYCQAKIKMSSKNVIQKLSIHDGGAMIFLT